MKKILIFLYLIIVPEYFAQNPSNCREVFLRTENTNGVSVTFTATTYQTYLWNSYYNLVDSLREQSITLDGDYTGCSYGFDLNHDCYDPPKSLNLGRNLYIITIDCGSASFLYNANGCTNVSGVDLFVTYDYEADAFYQGGNCSTLGEIPLTSYVAYIGTSCLEEYWTHCLSVIPSSANHPFLFWGQHPTLTIENYNVYRKINNQSFVKIGTTDSNTFEFTDDDFILNGSVTLQYYVTGSYYPQKSYDLIETSATNTIETTGGLYKPNKIEEKNNKTNFSLFQNHPNPFNPITKIKYSIPISGIVKLKVYNILGEEIKTLVNEYKHLGNYELQFNGSKLPSGVYFYRIISGNYSATRKMLLIK